jgi:hypothetical protein
MARPSRTPVPPRPRPGHRTRVSEQLPQPNRQRLLGLLSRLIERQLEPRSVLGKEGSDDCNTCATSSPLWALWMSCVPRSSIPGIVNGSPSCMCANPPCNKSWIIRSLRASSMD